MRLPVRRISWVPRLFLLFAAFMGVSGAIPRDSAAETMRMGVLPVVDTLPLWVGIEEKEFEKQGLDLKMISFESALERDAALQAGNLDGYFGDLLNTVLLIRSGQKIHIITTAYHTHPDFRMFGIATSPQSAIQAPADLRGQSVGISRATVIEYLLDRMLAQQSLKPDDISRQDIKKIPIRLQLLLADRIPSALLPEPLLSLAETKGARVILDDRQLNMPETVLAVTQTWVQPDPTRIRRFLTAYENAVARINQNPEAHRNILLKNTRFPETVGDRYRIPVFPPVALPPEADVHAVQDWLIQNGMADGRTAYREIVLLP
jgi:NitT/TauT family transport system substrate-binding protein